MGHKDYVDIWNGVQRYDVDIWKGEQRYDVDI
jgi:hypothetical protein